MYASYFGLTEPPFNITPDPRFLYLNACYQEALAALAYGIDARRGFVSVVGEAGTGKTTLLRHLLDSLAPSTRTVLLLNPTVSFDEILEHILTELGIPTEGGRKLAFLQRLNDFLIEHTRAGGNVALLIDEAQDLAPDVLEELRLLSNLETAREKIIQIVLAGQPELEAKLADPRLRQLRQRVTLPIHIRALSPAEVAAYVHTRLARVGGADPDLFAPAALQAIAELSHGIPRLVNVLCDAALLATFVAGKKQVTRDLVEDTWRDFAPTLPPATTAAAPEPAPAAEAVAAAPPTEPERAPAEAAAAIAPAAPVPAAPAAAPPPPDPPAPAPKPAAAPEAPPRSTAAPKPKPPLPPATPAGRRALRVAAAVCLVLTLAGALYALSACRELPGTDFFSRYSDLLVTAAEAVRSAPTPAPTAASTPPPPLPQGAGPLSRDDATAVVDAFRAAFEARDGERFGDLFAADASENGRLGRDAIVSGYRARLAALDEVSYTLADLAMDSHGEGATARSPFVIAYRGPTGTSGVVRGEAEWRLERRDGRPQIVDLSYRLRPEPGPPTPR
jgi:type II secretory pathway predicted ATPase ExeA